jgi:hypothetical protein
MCVIRMNLEKMSLHKSKKSMGLEGSIELKNHIVNANVWLENDTFLEKTHIYWMSYKHE